MLNILSANISAITVCRESETEKQCSRTDRTNITCETTKQHNKTGEAGDGPSVRDKTDVEGRVN